MQAKFPFKFHHLGYATQVMDRDLRIFNGLGYERSGSFFVDEKQGVRGCFLEGAGPKIELLENLEGRNTLTPWLSLGPRVYHFAYEVTNIEKATVFCESIRAKVLSTPTPSVAFKGRRISFLIFRDQQLIELIET